MNILGVTDQYPIEDIREINDFKTSSFTGFKKTDVKNKIMHCLLNGQLENICYWTAEFVLAGHFSDLWDICFYFLGKHIHLGNALLTLYLQKKYDIFRVIANDTLYRQTPLHLRNNQTVREMMAEIFCTMALSDKKHSYEELKIHEIVDVSHMFHHLRADHSQYADAVMRHQDPRQWTIAMNEFGYHISNDKSYNMNLACFWVEWMIQYDTLCKKRKQPLYCERRIDYPELESKYRGDFVLMIWEILVYYAKQRGDLEHILIQTLFQLFRVRYTLQTIKKRKPLLYFAISILTEARSENLKKEILNENNKQLVAVVVENVHEVIYQSLKEYEIVTQDESLEREKWGKNKKLSQSMEKLRMIRDHDILV